LGVEQIGKRHKKRCGERGKSLEKRAKIKKRFIKNYRKVICKGPGSGGGPMSRV